METGSANTSAATDVEIHYICIASNLLQKTMSELKCLDANNERLTLAMASTGHDLRQRLHTLLCLVDALNATDDPVHSAELTVRVKALIYRLAADLEQLALQADHDYRHVMPPSQLFNIASLLNQIHFDWIDEASAKHLHFRVSPAQAIVRSDQNLLSVIIGNVVGNAVRYTSSGEVGVDCALEDRDVLLTVRDTGPGISEWDLQRSFVPPPRVEGLSVALGRGLSIARRTAEVLGHEFGVASTPQRGTCISLRVPRAGEPQATHGAAYR
jgi:signal transduction histidine kinase